MNMKMRKNFALLAVLAVAVFVASAGLVDAGEKKRGADCDADDECASGDCIGDEDSDDVSGVCSGVTGGVDIGVNSDQIKSLTDQIKSVADQIRGSADEYCDGSNCVMKGKVVTSESGAKFIAESNYEDSLDMNGNKFTCSSQAVGGQGSAAQVAAGGTGEDVDLETTRHCTSDKDCPGDMKCAEGEGICYWPSDDEEQVTGPQEGQEVTEEDAVEDPRDQDNGGFLSNIFNNNADN